MILLTIRRCYAQKEKILNYYFFLMCLHLCAWCSGWVSETHFLSAPLWSWGRGSNACLKFALQSHTKSYAVKAPTKWKVCSLGPNRFTSSWITSISLFRPTRIKKYSMYVSFSRKYLQTKMCKCLRSIKRFWHIFVCPMIWLLSTMLQTSMCVYTNC